MRKTPVVMGVLSIVFGALMTLWCAFQIITQSYMSKAFDSSAFSGIPSKPGQPDLGVMMAKVHEATAQVRPVTMLLATGMVAASLALIVVGIGLCQRQAWSRMASIVWSTAALISIPIQIYLEAYVVLPKMQAAMSEAFVGSPGHDVMGAMTGVQTTLVFAKYILGFGIFPLLLLILMGRSSAKNDLAT